MSYNPSNNKDDSTGREKMKKVARQLNEVVAKLQAYRRPYEATWQLICDYIYPSMGTFTTKRTPGEMATGSKVDSYPTHACDMLASWLQTILTNSATNWFLLKMYGDDSNKNYETEEWLDKTDQVFRTMINDSNLDVGLFDAYRTVAALGTACLYCSAKKDSPLSYQTIHLNEIFLRNTYDSVIDSVFRIYTVTKREAANFFGIDKLSRGVKMDLKGHRKDTAEEEITLVHAVVPISEFKDLPNVNPKHKYRSIYMEKDTEHIIDVGGFFELPYIVFRWSVEPGRVYGVGPGWTALADIKMLNRMKATLIRAAEKAADPPYGVPEGKFSGVIKMNPGGILFMRKGSDALEPLFQSSNLSVSHDMVEAQKSQIGEIFFQDQLRMLNKSQMTATEVLERSEEKMRLLSPIRGRFEIELLQPLVERSFHLLNRKGYLPKPPPNATQNGLTIDYQSPIHKAQKIDSLVGLQKMIQIVQPYLQLDQQASLLFKGDEIIRLVADILNVPVKTLRSDFEVQQKLEEMQKQQEQQQQMEAQKVQAEVGQMAASAELDNARAQQAKIPGG